MAKNLLDITNEEIKNIFKIARITEEYKIEKRDNHEIILQNGKSKAIKINKDEIRLNQWPSSSHNQITNVFQIAQYLIDQGYRFEYEK